MENSVKIQELTDELYNRNFALLTPATHLSDESIVDFMEVMDFNSIKQAKPTVGEFINNNIEHINTQLKTRGALLIRGAIDCHDSFGGIPNSICDYRHEQNTAIGKRK